MDKQIIKAVIGEKQQQIGKTRLLQRSGLFDEHSNYVLVGVRRAGKSYTLYQDMQARLSAGTAKVEDFLFINFEDERLASMKSDELGLLLDAYWEMYDQKHPLIYLDEIQNIIGWEKFARRLTEAKYRVMITGSNAKMLSREIASTLGGSYIQRNIYPFSFKEYLDYYDIQLDKNWEFQPEKRLMVVRHFNEYFYRGGFAESFDKTDKREWLTSLYQKILMGDIVERNKIRNSRIFRLLARKLADSVMQPTSLKRLEHIIKSTGDNISPMVLKDYLEYMEDAYLIFSIPNLVSPLTEQQTIVKRYFADNGILSLFLMGGETKLLENIVAIQLNRHYHNTPDELRLFYYNKGVEIDFCIPEVNRAIQVSYSLDDLDTYKREVGGLVKFLKTYKQYQGMIVTWDTEQQIVEDGITIQAIPIWKWLVMNS
ncbi:MAG: ATP-binding protein [Bacteroidaceae bacterium]|nr:ATP-binding protein [Bacteroidaceae bacterium]